MTGHILRQMNIFSVVGNGRHTIFKFDDPVPMLICPNTPHVQNDAGGNLCSYITSISVYTTNVILY